MIPECVPGHELDVPRQVGVADPAEVVGAAGEALLRGDRYARAAVRRGRHVKVQCVPRSEDCAAAAVAGRDGAAQSDGGLTDSTLPLLSDVLPSLLLLLLLLPFPRARLCKGHKCLHEVLPLPLCLLRISGAPLDVFHPGELPGALLSYEVDAVLPPLSRVRRRGVLEGRRPDT